jgi:hypothetical protein
VDRVAHGGVFFGAIFAVVGIVALLVPARAPLRRS